MCEDGGVGRPLGGGEDESEGFCQDETRKRNVLMSWRVLMR